MLIISSKISDKISTRHNVTKEEVEQCIANAPSNNKLLKDTREAHKTNPPTVWFIGETDYGRKLKIVGVIKDGSFYLKTAYQPNDTECCLYKEHGMT